MNKIKSLALGLVIATGSLVVTDNQAQAAFLNGGFSGGLVAGPTTSSYNATAIRTDGGNFSLADANLSVSSTGTQDFSSLLGTNTGIYFGTTYIQTSNTIPGQAWRYSGQTTTPGGVYFQFANFQGSGNTLTFRASNNPAPYGLNNGSPVLPFSGLFGTLPGNIINGVFSVTGFDDTAGTLSFACTYSQNNPGPNPTAATCNASFAALGIQPASTPEPGSLLSLFAFAGVAGMSAMKKLRN